MFIRNTRPSFHLWRKGNLEKHRKVSKYYETDCLQNCILLFVLLSKTKFVKNFHIQDRILFISLKNSLRQTSSYYYHKFQLQWTDRKRNFQIRQILALIFHLIALILNKNSGKSLRVIKQVKAVKFKVV